MGTWPTEVIHYISYFSISQQLDLMKDPSTLVMFSKGLSSHSWLLYDLTDVSWLSHW